MTFLPVGQNGAWMELNNSNFNTAVVRFSNSFVPPHSIINNTGWGRKLEVKRAQYHFNQNHFNLQNCKIVNYRTGRNLHVNHHGYPPQPQHQVSSMPWGHPSMYVFHSWIWNRVNWQQLWWLRSHALTHQCDLIPFLGFFFSWSSFYHFTTPRLHSF